LQAIFFIEDPNWPVPEIVEDFLLCQMYGCTPSELDRQDSYRVSQHWFIHNQIKKIQAFKKG
jgi:hypothetical protein